MASETLHRVSRGSVCGNPPSLTPVLPSLGRYHSLLRHEGRLCRQPQRLFDCGCSAAIQTGRRSSPKHRIIPPPQTSLPYWCYSSRVFRYKYRLRICFLHTAVLPTQRSGSPQAMFSSSMCGPCFLMEPKARAETETWHLYSYSLQLWGVSLIGEVSANHSPA